MSELRMLPDERQIAVIDEAVAMGGLVMSVRQDFAEHGIQCVVTFVSRSTGEEIEWTCGSAAGLHAQEIMHRT